MLECWMWTLNMPKVSDHEGKVIPVRKRLALQAALNTRFHNSFSDVFLKVICYNYRTK